MNILCMGETLLRYSTNKGERFRNLSFNSFVGGSETNIACNLAKYGFNVKLLTKLPHNALADGIISIIKGYHVNTDLIIRDDKRVGVYYLEIGSGNRTSQVIYDRQYSSMTSFTLDDVNLDTLFKDIDVFVVSGITIALNPTVKDSVIEMMKYASKHQIKIVYDNNYRAKLWSIEKAGAAFKEVLPYVDILSAGMLDAKNFLNLTSQKQSFDEQLLDYYQQIKQLYPNIQYMTCTLRQIQSSSVNELTGFLYSDRLYSSKTYVIDDIVDRVGGGDAYLSGLLYGLLSDKDEQYSVEFAACASVLKHSVHGDINQFNVIETENFMNAGVSRINR